MKFTQLTFGFRFCIGLLKAGLLSVLLLAKAHADIWGYIDERGLAHFSEQRLDQRYELFYRTSEHGAAPNGRVLRAQWEQRDLPELTPPHRLVVFFEVSPEYKQVKHLLREAANEYQIDFSLLQALIAVESAFDASAVSPKGAVGLMQIMPATAGDYGVTSDRRTSVAKKLTNPRINIHTGSRLLRDLIKRYPGQLDLALAAYNAGAGAVRRAGNQVPNYKETILYVRTIMQLYAALKPPTLVAEQRNARSRAQL